MWHSVFRILAWMPSPHMGMQGSLMLTLWVAPQWVLRTFYRTSLVRVRREGNTPNKERR